MVDADVTPVDATTAGHVYVIEHAKALVLFDTGQDRASVTDDAYFPGGFTGKVLALKKQMPDLVVLPAHDPTAAARLPGT